MVAAVSSNPLPIPPAISSSGAGPLPPQTTTTRTQVSPSPVKVTVTQLVGGETLVTAQQVGGGSCLCADDVQPVPGDPEATVKKLQKVLGEAAEPGSSSSGNQKLLAEARAALSEAQAQIAAKGQGGGSGKSGNPTSGGNPYGTAYTGNAGVHTPQGVNAGSVSVFA